MYRLPSLTLALALIGLPLAAQVPANVPDVPGESPADRAQEQLIEANRGFLGRLFSTTSFDASPLPADGFGYQTNVGFGLDLPTGDAIFIAISGRMLPDPDGRLTPGEEAWLFYAGGGYTLNGSRIWGLQEWAYRTELTTELGVWSGESSMIALDVSPTYEVFRRSNWSLPVGLRLSLARVQGPDGGIIHPFVGFTVGAKLHLFARERLLLK